ncbi:MAG: transposase, partial [Pyrinomonadaceae bacterium]|nr:transposase [Pyrinomonadaceae bacterium]
MERTMSLSARQELALSLSPRYRQAKHPIKQKILDEFTAATHYHRKYALVLLSRDAHKNQDTKERRKPRTYNAEVKDALVAVWQASYRLCSKRFVPFLPEFLSVLERHGHLSLADEVRSQLLTISPATVDRLLCDGRHRTRRRSFGGTR